MPRLRPVPRILAALTLAGGLLAISACQKEQEPEGPPPLPGGAKAKVGVEKAQVNGQGRKIGVVPKGTAHSFWLAVKAGAEAAAKEAGAQIVWQGPQTETEVERQINIIQNLVTQQVDAIVMAACDTKALIPPLRAAKDAGIPVVTIDSGIDDAELPVSFVATDNKAAATEAAKQMAKLLEPGKVHKIGIIPFDPNAQSSQDREAGFKEGMKEFTDLMTLGPVLYSKSDPTEAVNKTENMLNSTPDLAGIFAANEPGGVGAAEVLKKRGIAGQVKLVAFDASEPEIQALREGTIQALIVQNPFRMGYDGVQCALKALAGQTVDKRIDTGVIVVTAENVDTPEVQKVLNPAAK